MDSKEKDLLSQFSAYVKVSIKHTRQQYLEKRARIRSHETSYGEGDGVEDVEEMDILCQVALMSESLEKGIMDIHLLIDQIDNSLLFRAVLGLSKRQKEVLLLRIVYTKRFKEIGAMLGISAKKAENTYFNSIRQIRKMIGGTTDGI
ncbi:MAG: sigma factor-like helix-turn-helix DNA-binding protein [Eubacteriales bacterium]|nr:sigma factor-like helix-turn-helix DNA-binding protein [Eubacteriales bacterium]